MSTLITDVQKVNAINLVITSDSLLVDLADGRSLSVPLSWFPRLMHGTTEERNNWRWIGNGHGIHWPSLDEDISIENLIMGKPSGENPQSLQVWLDKRKTKNFLYQSLP